MIRISYAPDLVEEAVLLAERTLSIDDRRVFRRERDRLYDVQDVDLRDERFSTLHWQWFRRLGLDVAIDDCIRERSGIVDGLRDARVMRACAHHEEGADLIDYVVPGCDVTRPLLAIRLLPSLLLDPASVRTLLHHELLHVDDMLNPAFGYERSLSPSDLGPLGDNLAQRRYRVVWDVTIDGRLARAGAGCDGARARWLEFASTFPMLGDRARQVFEDWFDLPQPTHSALAAFARAPGTAIHEAHDEERIQACDP